MTTHNITYTSLLGIDDTTAMFDDLFTPPILTFEGPHRYLSNFYIRDFVWEEMWWTSSEHAYQAAKSRTYHGRLDILRLPTPAAAKRAGKVIDCRPDWNEVKIDIMASVVRAKFEQNIDLKAMLVATGNAAIEEGNHWGDRIWGISPAGSGNGRNELGKILMALRAEWAV